MKRYKVIGLYVTIMSGFLELTPEQASAREHAIQPLTTKGQYAVKIPTGFKRGEEFGWDGEPNKSQLAEIEPAGPKTNGKGQGPCPTCGAARDTFANPQAFGAHKKKCAEDADKANKQPPAQ